MSSPTKIRILMARLKPSLTSAALATLSRPASLTEITQVASVGSATVYRHLRLLLDANQVHIAYYERGPKGGSPEIFYAVGPAPQGHTAVLLCPAPEELEAKAERRRILQRGYNREAKRKSRRLAREAYLAANPDVAKKLEEAAKKAQLSEEELDWIDPKFKYVPSKAAEPFATLSQAWNQAVKGGPHGSHC